MEIEYLETMGNINLWKLIKSRTFWTIIITFIINGIQGIKTMIPLEWMPYIDGLLGLLTIYFAKIDPRVDVRTP